MDVDIHHMVAIVTHETVAELVKSACGLENTEDTSTFSHEVIDSIPTGDATNGLR